MERETKSDQTKTKGNTVWSVKSQTCAPGLLLSSPVTALGIRFPAMKQEEQSLTAIPFRVSFRIIR